MQQLAGFGIGDAAGRVIFHDAIDGGDQIAAKDPIGGGERDFLGRGFQRGTPGVIALAGS